MVGHSMDPRGTPCLRWPSFIVRTVAFSARLCHLPGPFITDTEASKRCKRLAAWRVCGMTRPSASSISTL